MFDEIVEFFLFGIFDQTICLFELSTILSIFWRLADFDELMKLTNKKKKNITFFEIPEINLKLN